MFKTIKDKIRGLLHWSEKWTKTDMVYIAKESSWLTGNRIIGGVTAFCLAVAYARFLPKETYGIFKYVLSIAGILSIATLPGIDTALSRAVTLGYDGSVRDAMKIKLKWGLLGVAASVIISFYYFINHNSPLGISFLIVALFAPITGALSVSSTYLSGKKQFKKSSVYESCKNLISATALITTLFFFKDLIVVILIYYFSIFAGQYLFYKITFRKFKLNNQKDKETISFGKHLSAINVLDLVASNLDKILMFHFLGAAQLAVYSFAIVPTTQMQSLLKPIATIAFPKIISQDIKEIKKTLTIKIFKMSAVLVLPITTFVILAPWLFKIFFPNYVEAVPYAQVFALSILLFPARIAHYPIIGQVKKKILYTLSIFGNSVRIISYLIFIPLFGIWGAIYASIFSSLVSSVMTLYFFKKV
ncbi:MAG: oligosaccharide flippase family protein [bacterium]